MLFQEEAQCIKALKESDNLTRSVVLVTTAFAEEGIRARLLHARREDRHARSGAPGLSRRLVIGSG